METPPQILEFLDRCFESIKIPCLGNLNVDYLSSRLLGFRDEQQWILVFNSITWCPAGEGLTTIVECVGNLSKQSDQPNFHFDSNRYSNRYFSTGQIKYDESLNDYQVNVRGKSIPIPQLNVVAHPDLYNDPELDFAIALLDDYREELLASSDEYGVFIPDGLTEVLRLDAWHHPDWGCPPSQTESFPLIAEVLFTGNSDVYQPPTKPNTDWRLWFPK